MFVNKLILAIKPLKNRVMFETRFVLIRVSPKALTILFSFFSLFLLSDSYSNDSVEPVMKD